MRRNRDPWVDEGEGEPIQGFAVVEIQTSHVKLQGHGAAVFVTNEQMPLKSAPHASGEKGKPFSPQIWLISAHTGHIPVQRPISGGKTIFPLDIGHIWKKRPIEEGKAIFPPDMAHIRRENDFPSVYEALDEGKMIFPSSMA